MGGQISYNEQDDTEEYNGTSWSSGGNLSSARYAAVGGGSSSDAIYAGGENNYGLTSTEEYNGTSWSSGGTMITFHRSRAGSGTSNNAIATAGYYYDEETEETGTYTDTEEYNGSTWSSGGNLVTGRYDFAVGGQYHFSYL
jgi:hypothetical protein